MFKWLFEASLQITNVFIWAQYETTLKSTLIYSTIQYLSSITFSAPYSLLDEHYSLCAFILSDNTSQNPVQTLHRAQRTPAFSTGASY